MTLNNFRAGRSRRVAHASIHAVAAEEHTVQVAAAVVQPEAFAAAAAAAATGAVHWVGLQKFCLASS